MCTSSIVYVWLWHSVLITALLCLCSVQISAVPSARSLSRGGGSRITCWAASRLLPYLTIVSIVSQKRPWRLCFLTGWKNLRLLFVCLCLQRTCSVKTAESAPSVWRIWSRERPSPGWLASASTIRGNKVQLMYLHYSKTQTDTNEKRRV